MDRRAAQLITDLALAPFDDFTMLAEREEDAVRVRRDHPDAGPFI